MTARSNNARAGFLIVLLAALFTYGLIRAFSIRFATGEVYPEYSSLRAQPDGTKLLYDSLARTPGVTVNRNLLPARISRRESRHDSVSVPQRKPVCRRAELYRTDGTPREARQSRAGRARLAGRQAAGPCRGTGQALARQIRLRQKPKSGCTSPTRPIGRCSTAPVRDSGHRTRFRKGQRGLIRRKPRFQQPVRR